MSTASVTEAGLRSPAGGAVRRARESRAGLQASAGICVGLLVIVLYAAFAHGGSSLGSGTRIELAIAAVAAVAGAVSLWTRRPRAALDRTALAGVLLLGAFAAWSTLSVVWSIAPNQTWIEVNRDLGYVIALAAAMAAGAAHPRALEFAARGFVSAALAVTAYALGQKVLPGLHVPGVFDLNQTGPLPRLQEPLGYWNSLALFLVLAAPLALAGVVDRTRSTRARLTMLCGVSLMLVTIAFTYSRGGLLALGVALAACGLMTRERLRFIAWLFVAALGAVPGVVVGLSLRSLTAAHVSLASREGAGALLFGVLAASSLALLAFGRQLIMGEGSIVLGPARARRLNRLALAAAAVAVAGVLAAIALSSRGFTGTFSHAWTSFTTTRATSNYDPSRLLSADSQNRWVWWKEAAGAFTDRPLTGWGAGSFGAVHLLYRRNTLTVQQPHSVPLQFLSETGIVGTLLAIGAFALLLIAAVRALRRLADGRPRLLGAALLAGGLAYGVHTLYDWDWDIPAVTLPVTLFLGILIGAGGWGRPRSTHDQAMVSARGTMLGRALAVVVLTLWLCLFAVSAELPDLAAAKASSALLQAERGSAASLSRAQSSASLAAQLDPLSDAGPLVEATIAIHRGRIARALRYAAIAIARQPTDEAAWIQLLYLDTVLHYRTGVVKAAQRIIALDPEGKVPRDVYLEQLLAAPPQSSSSGFATPLPAS